MALIVSAILLGFFGSFHCLGMCGPIALSLPVGQAKGLKRVLLIFTYNAGRIFTYAILGSLFGLVGQTFVIGGYQQALSIITGGIILMVVIFSSHYVLFRKLDSFFVGFFVGLKRHFGKLFLKKGKGPLFLIGVLNGLLPCGLVYMAIAGSVATGNLFEGALFMAIFGVGTLPTMISLPLFGSLISMPFRNGIRKAMPIIMSVMGVLLIIRGLNLNIPYLSPGLSNGSGKIACTHEKNTGKIISCPDQSSKIKSE